MAVKVSKRQWATYVLASAITVGMVYVIMVDDRIDLRFLRTSTRILQTSARILGRWGLETERLYMRLVENGRMI